MSRGKHQLLNRGGCRSYANTLQTLPRASAGEKQECKVWLSANLELRRLIMENFMRQASHSMSCLVTLQGNKIHTADDDYGASVLFLGSTGFSESRALV